MICVFIQLRCAPGRTYEAADHGHDATHVSRSAAYLRRDAEDVVGRVKRERRLRDLGG